MKKIDLSSYIGLLVKIEIFRRTGHRTHVGTILSVHGNYVELQKPNGKTVWCKKPNCYRDTIELLRGK